MAVEEEFDKRMYYFLFDFTKELDRMTFEIHQKGQFQLFINHHLMNMDLAVPANMKWFEDRMNELIGWDRKILADVDKAIADINTMTEMLKQLDSTFRRWPFSIAVNADVSIFSTNRFKGDLDSTRRFFFDQLDTDEHALKKAKAGQHLRAKFWFSTSVQHHGMSYSLTPFSVGLGTPRFILRLNTLKAIAHKRVEQLRSILLKEDKYYAERAYHNARLPTPM